MPGCSSNTLFVSAVLWRWPHRAFRTPVTRRGSPAGFCVSTELMGFAQKVGLSDPLPPTAALPLFKGENALVDIAGFIVPLTKGDGRRRRQGSLSPAFCAKPN